MNTMPVSSHLKNARSLEADTVLILCDLVKTPSHSSKEKDVVQVIKKEMEAIGFDDIRVDALGHT